MSGSLPRSARIVVIGGGVGGASVAYHLAQRGESDVLLLERAELTSGSTFHSAGLVGQLRSDPTLTAMNVYSVSLYRELEAGENPPGWRETGSLRLASSADRLAEIRRQIAWARSFGLPLSEVSASEAADRFPLMSTDGVLGAAWMPTDGSVDPSQLCQSLAAGAKTRGVRIAQGVRVTSLAVEGSGHRRRIVGVGTDSGEVAAEIVVDCGGMFAAEIARMAGVRVPILPMSHQYLVTEPLTEKPAGVLPSLRDPDLLVYYRGEGDGLLMGGYERQSAPWSVERFRYDAVPADFNGRLLPPEFDRMEEISVNAARRVPVMGDIGIRTMINGPEAFTPDNEFCLGETEVGGFFVAAGFCAHGIAGAGGIGLVMADWILDGRPRWDISHMDIARFGASYRSPSYTWARTVENYETYYDIRFPGENRNAGRPLRVSPAYGWHVENGAVFGEKSGWERVDYYAANEAAAADVAAPTGWAGRFWSPAIAAEHRACRERAALFDESSFGKLEITGPDATRLMQWACDNDVARGVGSVTYTQLLNDRGGIEADVTVSHLGADEFLLVTGTASASRDAAWLRATARSLDADVRIVEVSGGSTCFALWGPLAREILQPLTPCDLSAPAFRFMTWQYSTVGHVPVRLARVTFTGELGWELYAPAEYGAALWRAVWEAGARHGMLAAGYRAIESLRLEKGYRVWGAEIGPEITPDEAGLSFCVKPDKAGGFRGREALLAARERGQSRAVACLLLADPQRPALGNEPVRIDGEIVGRIASGGIGYTVGASIAYALLPADRVVDGATVEVDLFGDWIPATITTAPLLP